MSATATSTVKSAADMQDMLCDIARLARNANYIMQEIQEEYFDSIVPDCHRNCVYILNEFERNSVRADVVADIIVKIAEIANTDIPAGVI